jgi:hypothetical protein
MIWNKNKAATAQPTANYARHNENEQDELNDDDELGFNPNEQAEPEKRSFELVEKGTYQFVVIESETKLTKDETGRFVGVKFAFVDGQGYDNRYLWKNFTIANKNATAMEIGWQQLGQLFRACHINSAKPRASDLAKSQALFFADVWTRKNKQTGEMENDIGNFSDSPPEKKPATPNKFRK